MTLKNEAGQPLSSSHPRWIVLDPMDSDPNTEAERTLEDVDESKNILRVESQGEKLIR